MTFFLMILTAVTTWAGNTGINEVIAEIGYCDASDTQQTASGRLSFGGMNSTAENSGTVILGYNRASDFISVGSLTFTSSVTIADGKMLTDGMNIYWWGNN